LEFDGISGTSAGAMNAVVLADGLLKGGREGAREALKEFWYAVAKSLPFDLSIGSDVGTRLAPGVKLMLSWTKLFSPSQLNPFDINPLRDIISSKIDFDQLRTSKLKLFVAATQANTGQLRLFRTQELTPQALLASACLPSIQHAIEIEGQPNWDGGYSANPAVFPLVYDCEAKDILLVLLSPLQLGETPRTAAQIREREMDLGFNSTFLREMRSLAQARDYSQSLLSLGRLDRRLNQVHFHMIAADDLMSQLCSDTKLTTSLPFLEMLRARGRQHAKNWLATHQVDIGRRSTIDIASIF
jgi:NTE family protein